MRVVLLKNWSKVEEGSHGSATCNNAHLSCLYVGGLSMQRVFIGSVSASCGWEL